MDGWWALAGRSTFSGPPGASSPTARNRPAHRRRRAGRRFDARCLTADELNSPYDLILLRVKPDTLPAVLDNLAPAVGQGTVAAALLNSMRHLDLLTERYPEATLGGVVKIVTHLEANGDVRQLLPGGQILIGELNGVTCTMPPALHTYRLALARPRGAVVCRTHGHTDTTRDLQERPGPQEGHQHLDRGVEHRPQALHLDRDTEDLAGQPWAAAVPELQGPVRGAVESGGGMARSLPATEGRHAVR
ncbi:2-dehydropantoate 2-reductase N-terminal domain-containing protein [Streptomyces chartreusis]|uniref:2-dehydropantoate 2-reductase N-terminal domain-containing protein n=1 Tax=Streptomyces chartreusis TaxID=1969 RepID=UPI0036B8B82F